MLKILQTLGDALMDRGLPLSLPAEPFGTLVRWMDEAKAAAQTPNPNAAALATADTRGWPSVRVVLIKRVDQPAGEVVFFTNYRSRKAAEIEQSGRAALVWHDDHRGRQVRLEGPVRRASAAESDAYFATRPLLSRLGAWASDQSRVLPSRTALLSAMWDTMQRFGVSPMHLLRGDADAAVPRPEHWGGYVLTGQRVELWQAGSRGRLHDRALYVRQPDATWQIDRLWP
ncbi:MAG: pyridoxamine 5'-phosphate oxidase [Planctomycetaceae bacterium]|jgi:pyridoxamine 5'-phosphate oxidase|nr:pyridoxamine 5'-phosphate oxidase [Phycisphaerales bacterium]MCE2653780.1 pyridoxamine 5'-phosphate oxidase [Planctomycetaceae bacterium]